MKKSIIFIIAYILLLHVFLPSIYYLFEDVFPVYSTFIDLPSFRKSFWIISTSLTLSVILLLLLPSKAKEVIKPHINGTPITELFYFATLFKLAAFFFYGGYDAVISGQVNGTFLKYVSLFLDSFYLLLVLILTQKKRSRVVLAIFFYVISITLSGSRSGILTIFFIFLVGLAFEAFTIYRRKINRLIIIGLVVSPILFIYGTLTRGVEFSDYKIIVDIIASRMSTLESAMHPVYFKDNGLEMDLFYEKFSFLNQLKLVIDGLIPGQIFTPDVMPNNYYRAIFTGYSKEYVAENYMSINITLPIYLYVKYGYFSIIGTSMYVISFYYITRFFRAYPLIVLALLASFYNLIYFFDFVMVANQLYVCFLTMVSIKLYIYFRREFVKLIKLPTQL